MMIIPNRTRVVALMSALALAGGLLTLALLAKPTQAQAESFTSNEWIPYSFDTVNPCTGELFYVEGTAHVVLHYTQAANGGYLVAGEVDSQGSAVAESGAKYLFQEKSAFHRRYNGYFPDNFTAAGDYKMIRQGSATPTDDFVIHFVGHFTVNANGEVTATFDDYTEECQ